MSAGAVLLEVGTTAPQAALISGLIREAVRLGLANRVVPGGKLPDEAMGLARRLAALPVTARRGTQRAVNLHLEQAMATVMEAGLAAERDSMRSPGHAEVVAELLAKSG